MMPCYWSFYPYILWFSNLFVRILLEPRVTCPEGPLTWDLMLQDELSVSQMLMLTCKRKLFSLSWCIETPEPPPPSSNLGTPERLPCHLVIILFKIAQVSSWGEPHIQTERSSTHLNMVSVEGPAMGQRTTQRLCSEFLSWCPHPPDGGMCFRVSGLKKMNSFSMLSSCLQILPPSREFASLWRIC
jgi:hypothetical protein